MNLTETWWGSLLKVTACAEIELTAAKMKKKEENPETKNAFICQPLISHSLTHSISHCSHSKQTEPNFQDLGSTKKTKKDSNFYSLITIFFSPPPIVSDDEAKNEMRDFIGKRLVGAKTIKIESVCECERVTWWGSDGD